MLFSSITFLYVFFPIVLLLYFLSPKKLKNPVLLLSSLFFYFFGEPIYVVLLLISSLVDYTASLMIEKHRGTKKAKTYLLLSIIFNLSLLGFFKYIDFFIGTFNSLLDISIPLTGVPLPIGISFFTFQTMSYTIDVYRGRVKAQKNLTTLATFVCLFPQLIAGPIVRYIDVEKELMDRRSTIDDIAMGIRRFTVGLGKKVLIANAMGELCLAFRDSSDVSVLFYWMYAIAFSLQIYFDFSGYSDMAIGLGRIFGFRFPENFNYPFIAKTITEFWQRWHMTLGGWFRDYVYIPLGGNRVSPMKWVRNLAIVWLLTGLWHGANWNFVLWGGFFGLILILEKLVILRFLDKIPRFINHIYVLFLVIISFVIFNGDGFTGAVSDLGGLFGSQGIPLVSDGALYNLESYGVLLVISILGAFPLWKNLYNQFTASKIGSKVSTVIEPLLIVAILIAVTAYLIDGSFNPFLYFRF